MSNDREYFLNQFNKLTDEEKQVFRMNALKSLLFAGKDRETAIRLESNKKLSIAKIITALEKIEDYTKVDELYITNITMQLPDNEIVSTDINKHLKKEELIELIKNIRKNQNVNEKKVTIYVILENNLLDYKNEKIGLIRVKINDNNFKITFSNGNIGEGFTETICKMDKSKKYE